MSLKNIDFGRDVAEFETNLADFFVRTPAYEAVKRGNKALVIGRKGTGKTAILKFFQETENPSYQYVIPIEATHSTYVKIDENLRSFTSQIKNIDSSFKLAWLFTTLLSIVDRLTRESTFIVNKEERVLYSFAKEHLSYNQQDPISAIAGYASEWIKNLKSVGSIQREINGTPNEIIFDETRITQLIKSAIQRINSKGRKVLLFYDRLDDRWDASDLYSSFLQGLLLAIKDLKSLGVDVAPVILLRDDIFAEVVKSFQHIDHFRMEIQRIEWDDNSLVQLIALRIESSLKRQGQNIKGLKPEEFWYKAFVPEFPAKKQAVPITAYMIERTLSRPRDIILFATYAKDMAFKDRKSLIEVKHIKEAEYRYSIDKLRDLIAEQSYKYPQLDIFLDEFRYNKIGIDLEDLRYKIFEIKETHKDKFAWLDESEDNVIKLLYRIGFISFTTSGGMLRGTRVVHSGVNPNDKIILDQKRIYVSPIFRRALEMKGA